MVYVPKDTVLTFMAKVKKFYFLVSKCWIGWKRIKQQNSEVPEVRLGNEAKVHRIRAAVREILLWDVE